MREGIRDHQGDEHLMRDAIRDHQRSSEAHQRLCRGRGEEAKHVIPDGGCNRPSDAGTGRRSEAIREANSAGIEHIF
jgi:hypothetical protein